MQNVADLYLSQLQLHNKRRHFLRQTVPILSLLVVMSVFWGLKLTGITMAGEAFCGITEHVHTEECPLQKLICPLEETERHVHNEACIQRTIICEKEETEGHVHNFDCLSKTLVCSAEEGPGHRHSDDCLIRTLTCPLTETGGHFHGASCTARNLVCSLPEDETHSHNNGCYEESLICMLAEELPHFHDSSCYTTEKGYICGMDESEAHYHAEDCYLTEDNIYSCQQAECEPHFHDSTCYRLGIGFGCGMAESGGHIHTAECLTAQTELDCGREATEGHSHTDNCYNTLESCPLEEHIHTENCYSDITADVETSDDWEMTLISITRSTRTEENIVMVAQSQLGYQESIRNFQVDENGVRRGYTRFGQWYGHPYGDWSSMFVSFCLYYAGVEDVPANAGVEAMRLEWEQASLYSSAEMFSPVRGHLLFLDKDGNGTSDSVAIITGFEGNEIAVIEGDLDDIVTETSYAIEDPAIMGYGIVPFEPEIMLLSLEGATPIAVRTAYNQSLFTNANSFVLYADTGSGYIAIDGNGKAVPITVDENGVIFTNLADPNSLLWNFSSSGSTNSYYIQNRSTNRYMHAANGSVTTSGRYSSVLITSGNGIKIRSNSDYAQLNLSTGTLQVTQNQNQAITYQLGISSQRSVWLDGTNGGIMSLSGSPDTRYSVIAGTTMVLPSQWDPPAKYDYTLQGWYDVTHNTYYPAGAEVVITENTVFYADWIASNYNIGQYNSLVANTVSTSDFVTTRVFDYNALFNVLSSKASVSISDSGHTETWQVITSGSNAYNGDSTLSYIFRDWDRGNEDITYPSGSTNQNTNGGVYSGLYSARLRSVLFDTGNSFDPATGTGIIGKKYLGTADHLFQYAADPSHPYYGYYYYDSALNAASYNQSAGRFYVYNYLECTDDSAGNNKYSDFLPLNSPYANTNGSVLPTYSYGGDRGEYNGTTHYMYDAKYNTGTSAANHVATNFFFGMSIDINFYLPNSPGTVDSTGSYGNRDLFGNEMHFKFSGDDDVWVLVDGQLVLDIGGIHGIESGDINFSSGVATVNGTRTGSITNMAPGDHTLTVLYLERGSSQSNCAIYFNLAPRFSFSIQKEDVLTQDILNGAQFSVYTDKKCTVPAELWVSKDAHDRGESPTNTFTVTNGTANMWGMGAGNTYYIRETKPPDNTDYSYASGIICVSIDKQGVATYNVELIPESNSGSSSSEISKGFTVHGFRIDEQSQNAYIIATNAPSWVEEVTSVHVQKKWNDSLSHKGEQISVYLTVTDPDGTVSQIRQVQLGSENNWTYTWDNLPKYYQDGTTILYGVQEVGVPGYMGTVEAIDPDSIGTTTPDTGGGSGNGTATNATAFENGSTYLLQTPYGYLAAANSQIHLVSTETEAIADNTAQWVATVNSDGTVVLQNKVGQVLYYSNYSFRASSSPESTKNLHYSNNHLSCTIHHSGWSETLYPIDSNFANNVYYNHIMYTTGNSSESVRITLKKLGAAEPEVPDTPEISEGDFAYRITNTPLDEETSLTVHKAWDYGFAGPGIEHEQAQVTVALLANGRNTGRTVTLNLRNSWRGTFQGLPYKDSNGNVISYSVEERWQTSDWITYYGEIVVSNGDPPTYSTTITNVYRWGTGVELPSTGSAARLMYILCGGSIMLASLVYGIGLRRKRERRTE